MKIMDATQFNNKQPQYAEGHICLSLTDPLTGKIKEQINGKNHVFTEQLFKGYPNGDYVGSWTGGTGALRTSNLCLNDDGTALDVSFPYLRGKVIGYGTPSTAGSGTTRGAYNAANQVLGACSVDKTRWKFQYDFTTAQANGIIRNMGLTNQYGGGLVPLHGRYFNQPSVTYPFMNDGRYTYSCSTAGIITKYDMWVDSPANTTIDLSAIIGTTSSSNKFVGYAPNTGKYYIWVYSATASLRRMYVFSDNTFSTLEKTYSPTNIAFGTSDSHFPIYIYGNYVYYLTDLANTLYKADFVNNIAYNTITLPNTALPLTGTNTYPYSGSVAMPQGIGMGFINIGTRPVIFDPSTDSICVTFSGTYATNFINVMLDPNMSSKTIGIINKESGLGLYKSIQSTALTTYVLPEPVVKTSANGMTVTYELEVFW